MAGSTTSHWLTMNCHYPQQRSLSALNDKAICKRYNHDVWLYEVVNYGVAQLQHNKQALKPLTAVNLSEQASEMSHFCFQNTLCTQ